MMHKRHALVGCMRDAEVKRDFQLRFLRAQGLEPYHRLLDLGCGTLRAGISIIEYLDIGGYVGLDVRPFVLQEAINELAETGTAYRLPQLANVWTRCWVFDYVWAFATLIHMTDEVLTGVLGHVAGVLSGGGQMLANVNVGPIADVPWQGFPVVSRPLSYYRDKAYDAGMVLEDMGALRDHGHLTGTPAEDNQRIIKMRAL